MKEDGLKVWICDAEPQLFLEQFKHGGGTLSIDMILHEKKQKIHNITNTNEMLSRKDELMDYQYLKNNNFIITILQKIVLTIIMILNNSKIMCLRPSNELINLSSNRLYSCQQLNILCQQPFYYRDTRVAEVDEWSYKTLIQQ